MLVQTVIQQTLGRIEAELAALDADMTQCDAAAARLHRELAAARERCNPSAPLGSPPDPQPFSRDAATAVLSQRRTNGAHLPSLGGAKAGELPEGFLYEAVDLPEEASEAVQRKQRTKEPISPGVLLLCWDLQCMLPVVAVTCAHRCRQQPAPYLPQVQGQALNPSACDVLPSLIAFRWDIAHLDVLQPF